MTGFKVILKSKDAMVSVSVSKNFRFRRKATKRDDVERGKSKRILNRNISD